MYVYIETLFSKYLVIFLAVDAQATRIDIFIDIEKFTLQVNDNGFGILNMNKIGQRHGEF